MLRQDLRAPPKAVLVTVHIKSGYKECLLRKLLGTKGQARILSCLSTAWLPLNCCTTLPPLHLSYTSLSSFSCHKSLISLLSTKGSMQTLAPFMTLLSHTSSQLLRSASLSQSCFRIFFRANSPPQSNFCNFFHGTTTFSSPEALPALHLWSSDN